MPALQPVPGVVRITLKFVLGADLDVVNRFFQKYTGTPGTLSDAGALAWATAAAGAWSTHLAPLQRTDLTLVDTTVEDLTSATGAAATFPSGGTGGDSGQGQAAGVAMVIQQKIERRYRGGHPRQYLAAISSAHLTTEQTWDPAFVASMTTDYTAFRAAVAAGCPTGIGPATDVNVSYFEGFTNHTFPSGRVRPIPNPRAVPLVDQIASFAVNPKVGSQRRRNLQSA